MRIALITLSILLNMAVLAQKPSKKPNKTSFEQKIQIADKLFKEGKTIEALQSYNIARILAGADNAKHTVVDKRIEAVFKAIEQQKEEAIKNEQKAKLAEATAKKSEIRARIATNNATALYWSAEANKYNPIQSIRLLEKAYTKTNDTNVLQTIKDQINTIFNQSNNHQWREINRFFSFQDFLDSKNEIIKFNRENISKIVINGAFSDTKDSRFVIKGEDFIRTQYSSDGKWVVAYYKDNSCKIFSSSTKTIPSFLKESKRILFASFSNDSKLLVTTDESNLTKVWGVDTGNILDIFEYNNVYEVSFSPKNEWLIIKKYDNGSYTTLILKDLLETRSGLSDIFKINDLEYTLVVRNIQTTNEMKFLGSEKGIKHISFSSDNQWLITIDKINTIKIWNIVTGKLVNFLMKDKNINDAFFSPDGKWIVTTDKSNNIKILELATGEQLGFLMNEKDINKVIFSADSKWLLTKNEKQYRIWEVETGRLHNFLDDEKKMKSVMFSVDSKWLITQDKDKITKVWELGTDKEAEFLKEETNIEDILFSLDGKLLLTKGKMIKIWEIAEKIDYNLFSDEQNINDISFSPDSKWLITRDENLNPKVWSVDKGQQADFLKKEATISGATFSPDSKWLITRDKNLNPKVWSVDKRQQVDFLKEKTTISDATFSPDSKWLVTTDSSDIVKVWLVEKGQQAAFLKEEATITDATFSPDSKWLVTTDTSDIVTVWSVDKGQQVAFLKEEATITDATFSPDSKWLITTDHNQNAKVWSVEKWIMYDFLRQEKKVYHPTFSPNSKLLVTRGDIVGGFFKIWSVENGMLYNFLKDEKNIIDGTFSQDTKWLLTTYYLSRGIAKIWSVEKGIQADFIKDEKNISSVIFSQDSKLLSISTNHQVKTYEIATGKLIQTLWLNKIPTQVDIIDNRYLYVTVGKAIVKTDLQTQQGNLMSYGDGEPLNYKFEEIQAWIKVFGDKYLLPLDEELKKKYGVD